MKQNLHIHGHKKELALALLAACALTSSAWAADADQSLNLGTDGIAMGNGAIVTGQNGIAIGKGAVATGDNLDADSIKDLLAQNEAQLQHIQDLKDQIAQSEEDFNASHEAYLAVQQAQQQIAANEEKLAQLEQEQQSAQTAVDNFKPDYDAAVADMNDKLDAINKIDFTLAGTDEGLDQLAAELKQTTEEGHNFSLDVSWYKQYIQNAIAADADLREANDLEQNGWQPTSTGSSSWYGFSGSSNHGINANYSINIGNIFSKSLSATYSYDNTGVFLVGFSNDTLSLQMDNAIYFDYNDGLVSPIDLNTQQYTSTYVYTEEQYNETLQAIDQSLADWNTFVDGQQNIWAQDEISKTQLREVYTDQMNIAKLYAKDMYLQGEYERNGHNLEDLQKRKEVDQQIVDAINAYNEKYGQDFKWQWEINHDQWYQENIANPTNANTQNKEELKEKFQQEIQDKQEQMDELQDTLDTVTKQIEDLKKQNQQLQPTQEQLQQAASAEAAKEKLDADKAALEQALAELDLNDLTDKGENAIAMGTNALVTGKNAVGIGTDAIVTGENGVGIGEGVLVTALNGTALGAENTVSGENGTAVGYDNTVSGKNGAAIGAGNLAGTENSVVIGFGSSSYGDDNTGSNIVIGSKTQVTASQGIAIGDGAFVQGAGSIALGAGSIVGADETNVFSIGSSDSTRRILHVTAGVDPTDAVNVQQMNDADDAILASAQKYVNDQLAGFTGGSGSVKGAVTYDEKDDGTTDYDNISLGDGTEGSTTAIHNVADGTVSTDAVNKGQMDKGDAATLASANSYTDTAVQGAKDYTDTQINTVKDLIENSDSAAAVKAEIGDTNYTQVEGTELKDGDTVTDAIGKVNNKVDAIAETAGKHNTVSAGSGISITETENAMGGTDYEVGISSTDFTLGNKDGEHVSIEGDKGSISATGTVTAGGVTINGTKEVTNPDGTTTTTHTGTINGLQNTKWDSAHYTSGQAATEDQLAAGLAEKADLSEMRDFQQEMYSSLSDIRGNVDEVAAGTAALAALDYLPYDPDDKLSFAVGSGTYRDKTAMALGMKYYPNEDISINAGTTLGYNDNMWNVGVSFRFGSHTERAARLTPEEEQSLVQTVMALAERVNALEARNAELEANAAGQNGESTASAAAE